MEVKEKGKDDRPDDLGDLEMTWLAWGASAATAYTMHNNASSFTARCIENASTV